MGCHRKRAINYSLGVTVLCGTLGVVMPGCSRPLLSPTEERSPFDRYDNVRGNYAPQYIEDQYGRREPNLRGRLTPKE